MANKYCNLDGSKKIKDEYQKINIGFDKVEEDVNKINDDINVLEEDVNALEEDVNKINDDINALEEDVNKINDDINALDERVDEIITTPAEGVSAQEIIDARGGRPVLGKRFEDIEDELDEHKAENMPHLMQVNNKIYQYGLKQENGFVKFIYKEVE